MSARTRPLKGDTRARCIHLRSEYRPPEEPEYPYHDRAVRVTQCGRICIGKRKINLSTVFAVLIAAKIDPLSGIISIQN